MFLAFAAVSMALVFFQKGLYSVLDVAALAAAEEQYFYEIEMKLVWTDSYNLDLYVTEPSGDVASRYNVTTSSGGEIGFYKEGRWNYGDSGDNIAPKVYRTQYGLAGVYDINVFFNPPGESSLACEAARINGSGANIDIANAIKAGAIYSTEVFVHVTLYGDSQLETYLRFPESEAYEMVSGENDGWWHAGSFNFTPVASKPFDETWWDIEKDPRCFVATAAYGTALAPGVQTLSLFRDRYLAGNRLGRLLLRFYYKISPPAAKAIQKSSFLKIMSRVHLNPVVKILGFFIL